jgi:error-prone DNA polymerase
VAALERIAEADGFASLGIDRRQALWRVKALGHSALPLFAAADAREEEREPAVPLKPMSGGREVVEDYRSLHLSLRAHPVGFIRPQLDSMKIIRCGDLQSTRDGRRIDIAGIVLIRQRPGKGNVTFLTIEDETGIANIIVWQRLFELHRRAVMSASLLKIRGTVQHEGNVIHVIAEQLEDLTPLLHEIGEMPFPNRHGPADGANKGPDRREWAVSKTVSDGSARLPARQTQPALKLKSRDFH